MSEKLYAQRDRQELGQYCCDHVLAMTRENLHSKAAIAAELGYRDAEIARLKTAIANMGKNNKKCNCG